MLSLAKISAAVDTYLSTPVTFAVYVCGLNLDYMRRQGLQLITEANARKAELLYAAIDASNGYYRAPVHPKYRSLMNVLFFVKESQEWTVKFAQEAEERKLYYLIGHPAVGGIRASIYNAMSLEGVQALICFMQDFQLRHP